MKVIKIISLAVSIITDFVSLGLIVMIGQNSPRETVCNIKNRVAWI